jgi:hypothetical protein
MEKNILDRFRDKLKAHRDAIYEWFNNESDEKKLLCCAVHLGDVIIAVMI